MGRHSQCPADDQARTGVSKRQQAPPALPARLLPLTALDLETHKQGTVHRIGAVSHDGPSSAGEPRFAWRDQARAKAGMALARLDDFCRQARFILGHNLIGHDLPILRSRYPHLALLRKPVIDTLYLSPLAFPRNPYHHLVKDYKRVRDTINDPVADAQLSLTIFQEQYAALQQCAQCAPDLLGFYHYCFAHEPHGSMYRGLTDVLRTLVTTPFPSHMEALEGMMRLGRDRACPRQLQRIAAAYLSADRSWTALAYSVGWLQVAAGNSILPPWVRHRFPDIPAVLAQLREEHCGDDGCAYCAANHDPVKHLRRFFSYPNFRVTDDGQPLQRELVMAGMAGKSVLGVLPTSGGKSICFQVPALARYYRRGLLTVVVSPLQALMKDQVDNLQRRTGSPAVAAIYGLLTPPERGAVLEAVRLGDIGLLYLSPEQLRNRSVVRVLAQREMACWVFDEAHCLSQWGHDFRPDYLYCGRFIRERADKGQHPIPPVACFTATAKDDVIDDIRQHFRTALDLDLEVMNAGVHRDNLEFQVHVVTQAAKSGRVAELLAAHLPEAGSCIVYCATRRATEEMARFLTHKGYAAEHYHGKLDPPAKKEVLDNFMGDRVRVICATNAFGMGVDKENVRLVVHAQVPGSLESYLQEAGRAGRDGQDALCILLFDEQDIETQFQLRTLSKVHQWDIQQVLRGIRHRERRPGQDIVITPGELLRSEEVNTSFNLTDPTADTKVKTAVSWLERSGFLERNENSTQVFSGKPLFATLDEALQKLDRLQLKPAQRKKWEVLLHVLINTEPDEGLSADYLAEQMGRQSPRNDVEPMGTVEVMDILRQMADAGIVSHGLLMTAFLRPKGRNAARGVLKQLCHLEEQMLDRLIQDHSEDAEHPDDVLGATYPLDLRLLNQTMLDTGIDHCNPQILRNLLKSLAADGQGLAASRASIDLHYVYRDNYRITLNRTWNGIRETAKKRHRLARRILKTLYQKLDPDVRSSQGQVLVQFSLQELLEAIQPDTRADRRMAALERGLLFLHEQNVIILQQGLAVFRQAMIMKLKPEAHGRRYNRGDYDPLDRHYQARVTQVHIMNEYAHLGQDSMMAALLLVQDYFNRPNVDFLNRYFRGRREMLQLATSQQSLKNIVEALGNPQQQAIVQAPTDQNILILAGPGAGKTRVIVHRCAYMVRVHRIPPSRLLVLCFNHSAAVTLRRRLQSLLERDAYGIGVYTFHGLAMRLLGNAFELGRSPSGRTEGFDFDKLILQATALLRGETALPGIPDDQLRASLLSGIQHILVDEYQDIDAAQYDMISAIAGRTLSDDEEKLSILAVGDDDQSIYAFRQANVKYIRQFAQDYQAQHYYLVQNYRSTGHIITAANGLIRHNRDRMKTEQAIRINDARQAAPAGGPLAASDPVSQGKVQIIVCPDIKAQTTVAVQELQRLRDLCPDLQWSDCAVLARRGIDKPELTHFRSAAEHAGIPLSLPQTLPLFRIREFHRLLDWLDRHRETLVTASCLLQELDRLQSTCSPWKRTLRDLVASWEVETAGSELPASAFRMYLSDYLREARREQRFGDGVHMGTVHSSKGLEFRVVVLLDGHWALKNQRDMEEERRLFYVGMTRAIDSLVILRWRDERNPHIARIPDTACHERLCGPAQAYPLKQYRILGMQDLFLGYAGHFKAEHPIHAELRRLNAGDTVEFLPARGHLLSRGQPIARLSRSGRAAWQPRGDEVLQGRVLALSRRRREDEDEVFLSKNKCSEWYIPLVEVVWRVD